ncbi:hypothetical protein BDF20DRAFT_910360 [Mycotypha africana]|uniref:uncharacterized protein n=1 Tax=Mycotypha africana TaxID=64632 RepID=UPI002300706D|nr:uncharacterized protein BDF20DRAFT_910360 [Mycotypha africana]KAI8987806.1 hypothetical protein BDF20DRAFT_910360 [Mycotypha africana]
MFFQKNPDSLSIRNFHISTSSGVQDSPIAYGPGSIINGKKQKINLKPSGEEMLSLSDGVVYQLKTNSIGSLMITLDKPILESYSSIRVVFKCIEESAKNNSTVLFSVATTLCSITNQNGGRAGDSAVLLSKGSHMFLFAIRLPQVNYPPSMHHSIFGRRINYTLTGVIEPASAATKPIFTETVPILYLPLIVCDNNTSYVTQQRRTFENNGKKIKVTAELVKASYCPGDVCTVKMMINNMSRATKIKHVQISFVEIMSTLTPSLDQMQHQRHTLFSDTFYLTFPSNSKDINEGHHDIFKFDLPRYIVPTFTSNMVGRHLEIKYEVVITIPALNQQSSLHFFTPNNTVSGSDQHGAGIAAAAAASLIKLPVKITTVPPEFPIGVTIATEEGTIAATEAAMSTDEVELPTFIPNIESPVPSPVNYPTLDRPYSVSPSNSFRLNDDEVDMDEDDNTLFSGRNGTINYDSSIQDASGHLMVPEIGSGSRRPSNPANTTTNTEPTTVS